MKPLLYLCLSKKRILIQNSTISLNREPTYFVFQMPVHKLSKHRPYFDNFIKHIEHTLSKNNRLSITFSSSIFKNFTFFSLIGRKKPHALFPFQRQSELNFVESSSQKKIICKRIIPSSYFFFKRQSEKKRSWSATETKNKQK